MLWPAVALVVLTYLFGLLEVSHAARTTLWEAFTSTFFGTAGKIEQAAQASKADPALREGVREGEKVPPFRRRQRRKTRRR